MSSEDTVIIKDMEDGTYVVYKVDSRYKIPPRKILIGNYDNLEAALIRGADEHARCGIRYIYCGGRLG